MVRSRPRSLPRLARAAASGRLLGVRARVVFLFRLWLLPDRRALAGGSVLFGFGGRHRLAAMAVGAAPRHRRRLFLHRAAGSVVRFASWLSIDRARRRRDHAVGRRAGDHRRGHGRHRGLAADRHLFGAGAPLRASRRAAVLGDLHRVRPRRAADHRAVHGERDAAAVRPRTLGAGQARARADRRGAVRVGLHGGGGARRAGGDPARAIRGGAGVGARLTGA